MTTKTKTIWRLANRPTPQEVIDLKTAGLLTHDEAREILISQEEQEDRDKKSLQEEIKFLRSLVQNLANNRYQIVNALGNISTPNLPSQPWYVPYQQWMNLSDTSTQTNAVYTMSGATSEPFAITYSTAPMQDFTEIKTF